MPRVDDSPSVVGQVLFSPDESTVVYVGQVGDEYYVVVDGERRFGPYPDVSTIAFNVSGAIRVIKSDGDGNYSVFETVQ